MGRGVAVADGVGLASKAMSSPSVTGEGPTGDGPTETNDPSAGDVTGDLVFGAFSDDAPWQVEPDLLRWRAAIGAYRARNASLVPDLLRRRRIPPLRRVARTGRELGTALLGWAAVERRRGRRQGRPEVSRTGLSRRLRLAFEHLGPTYIKLGQIISSGEGLFPAELVGEFKLLRDRVPAESWEDVEAVVVAELGLPIDSVFSAFEHTPIAAASVAQVHAATLLSGERVVVKVQRPTVAAVVRRDLAAMSWIAPALIGRIPVAALANPPALVELFAETIIEELDFRLEADNMLDVAHVLASTGQRSIVVPRPHPTLVTRRVLVMERLDGFSFDDVDGMHAAGIDTQAVVHALMIAFLEGATLFGVFHGDLHGGNLFVQTDGRVALLDYGITGRLDQSRRLAFLRMLMGGSINNPVMQLSALRDLGALPTDTDIAAVVHDLGLDQPTLDPTTMAPEDLLKEVRNVIKLLLEYGARFPKVLMLFVKDLLFLDGAMATLAPDVDLFSEVMQIAGYFTTRYGDRIASDIGLDPRENPVDMEGLRAAVGVTDDIDRLSYRDLQARRELIRKRMDDHRRTATRPGRRAAIDRLRSRR